ncbi:MAG: 30S ribosomal protein S6--L-glutamate ligase [Gammaproteobacteria bacterium]
MSEETPSYQKTIVGSEEWCELPDLNIPAVKARIDSGAKTSCVHASNIQTFKRDNTAWVRFDVHPLQSSRSTTTQCEARVLDRRIVKSSNGESEKRYVISTTLSLGGKQWDIELTLANRDSMGFRVLIGREAMNGRLLVDPEKQYALGDKNEEELRNYYGKTQAPSAGLKIGLLASNPNLYSNRRIMEAGEEAGHEMVFLNIRQCFMKLDADTPEVHYRGGIILNELDAVIPRIKPSITFYGCALVRQFESIGIMSLNGANAISQSRDKLYCLQRLLKNGIDIPVSGFASSPFDTDDVIEMVGGAPLIVKLLEGTQGRGVVLAETDKAAESVINAFKAVHANLLVQEFVKEAQGRDLRCFVIDGKVVASIERQAAAGEFRANLHRGGTASLVKLTPDEKKLAIKAASTLGLKVAGVDIIRSSNGPLLLELNSSPGLEGIESATGKDVATLMIQAVEKAKAWKAAGVNDAAAEAVTQKTATNTTKDSFTTECHDSTRAAQ